MARPAFKPTKEQRKLVKSLAAIGMRHDDIAVVIGVQRRFASISAKSCLWDLRRRLPP